MDSIEDRKHNIYDLFDDDYRQCNITFDEIINGNQEVLDEYFNAKYNPISTKLYGARGIIYKAIFDKFKHEGLFNQIGVLEIGVKMPLVSNARMILNYLNYHTYSKDKRVQKHVAFEKIVNDFNGIICKEDIDKSLIAMFRLGDDSSWNELIAFNEIHSENLETCEGLNIFITKAGHEYLDLIATHFEFFNTRVNRKRSVDAPLFSEISNLQCDNPKYEYNFQETISNVIDIVKICCDKMSKFYEEVMQKRFKTKEEYMTSPFVYNEVNVLHGERIIHTHIRYIDSYRLYVLMKVKPEERKKINEYLVKFIIQYITMGEEFPLILTNKSTEKLFPIFKDKIKIIVRSNYEDYTTKIDV